MTHHARAQADFVPHLPDLIVNMAICWRAIRDTQSEVDPFGRSFGALEEARVGLEALAHHLTGQNGFLALANVPTPRAERPATATVAPDAAPF